MYVFERMMGQLCRKITNRACPEKSMATNWALGNSLTWAKPIMSARLDKEVRISGVSNRSLDRVQLKLTRLVVASADTAHHTVRSTKGGLPMYDRRRRGHSRRSLSPLEIAGVCHALTCSDRNTPGQVILPSHLAPGEIEAFTCAANIGGFTRTTAELDRISRRGGGQGKSSSSACYLSAKCAIDRAVAARIREWIRVTLLPSKQTGLPEGMSGSFALAFCDIYRLLPRESKHYRSFGYTTVDIRLPTPAFICCELIGAPVSIVRSPRVTDPSYLYWLVEAGSANQ